MSDTPTVSDHPKPKTCWARDQLLASAKHCEDKAARHFATGSHDHDRAAAMLRSVATACRKATVAFDTDPTLIDESSCGRFRAIDVLAEIGRQLPPQLRIACGHDSTVWEVAEGMLARAITLAERIPQAVPRPNHATVEGSRAISRERLAANHTHLADAVKALLHAADGALQLPHPHPDAVALAKIANHLERQAADLKTHYGQILDQVNDAFADPRQ